MNTVELRDLRVRFGEKSILESVSLTLTSEHRYALVGSSGSGKTTLLRLLAGLQKPSGGKILFSPPAPVISYAFQEPRLFPQCTVRENLSMVSPERDIDEILAALDLSGEKESRPATLSGGMQKRVGLARALAKKADVYLLDEPTGGQDLLRTEQIVRAVRDYTAGAVLVVATHEYSILPRISDTVIIVQNRQLSVLPTQSFSADMLNMG